jgi:hypothetical protein
MASMSLRTVSASLRSPVINNAVDALIALSSLERLAQEVVSALAAGVRRTSTGRS